MHKVSRTRSQVQGLGVFVLLLLSLALSGMGCGEEAGLVVDLRAWPQGAALVRVQSRLNGNQGSVQTLSQGQTRFVVRLPVGATGRLHLELTGIDQAGCKVARGELDETLGTGLQLVQEATVSLAATYPSVCTLTVNVPSGRVDSYPLGIACSEESGPCEADFRSGLRVKLSYTPSGQPRAPLGLWTDGCVGFGDCSIVVDRSRTAGLSSHAPASSNQNWSSVIRAVPQNSTLSKGLSRSGEVWMVTDESVITHCDAERCRGLSLPVLEQQLLPGPMPGWSIWAAGARGEAWSISSTIVLRCHGGACAILPEGSPKPLTGLIANEHGVAWATNGSDTLLRCSGFSCTSVSSGVAGFSALSASVTSHGIAWFGGLSGALLRCSESACKTIPTTAGFVLVHVATGTDEVVWAAASSQLGWVERCEGEACTKLPTGVSGAVGRLVVSATGDAWMVGDGGAVIRCNATGCNRLESPTTAALRDVRIDKNGIAWVVGDQGTILTCGQASCAKRSVPEGHEHGITSMALASDGSAWMTTSVGTLFRCSAIGCIIPVTGTQNRLRSVVAGEQELFLFGEGNIIVRCQGTTCASTEPIGSSFLSSVVAGPGSEAWTFGSNLFVCQGQRCPRLPFAAESTVRIIDVIPTAPSEAWALGTLPGGFPGAVEGSWISRCKRGSCTAIHRSESVGLYDLAQSPSGDLWAVGDKGVVLRCHGSSCVSIPSGSLNRLLGVTVGLQGGAWAVGEKGTALYIEDGTASLIPSGTTETFGQVIVSSRGEAWVRSQGTGSVFRCDKTGCVALPGLSAVKGMACDSLGKLWMVVGGQRVLHCDGFSCREVFAHATKDQLYSIAVGADGLAWVGGAFGNIFRCDAQSCESEPTPSRKTLRSVSVAQSGEVWAASWEGDLVRRAP